MSLALQNRAKIEALQDRSNMLRRARNFFYEREILEVDCPILSRFPSIDPHIDVVAAGPYFLHTSPEYRMKELLALGIGDIYCIGHVFRDKEVGPNHRIEFTMAEWYRNGFSLNDMIEETLQFIKLFIGDIPTVIASYASLFDKVFALNPHEATRDALLAKGIAMGYDADYMSSLDKTDLTIYLFSLGVEPLLDSKVCSVVVDYPQDQCALAAIEDTVARRFEIYYAGYELANGYYELTDANELLERLNTFNAKRMQQGKTGLSLDVDFVEAHNQGLPSCSGVAVGFDRLMMVRRGALDIGSVIV